MPLGCILMRGGQYGSPCMGSFQNSGPRGATAYTRLTHPGSAAERCGAYPVCFRQGLRLGCFGGAGLPALHPWIWGGRNHLCRHRRLCQFNLHLHRRRRCHHFLLLHRRRPGWPPHTGGGFNGLQACPGQNLVSMYPVGLRE